MRYTLFLPIALALVVLGLSCSTVMAAPADDLTIVGISSTGDSSIRLGIEPGVQQSISFANVTWYIYGSGEVVESVDGNVTARHQVDGLLVAQSRYEAGRHVITFRSESSTQQYTLMISESASAIDWEELTGEKKTVTPGDSEVHVWLVSLLFFLAPMPLVYRRVQRRKRSEVVRIV